MNNLGRLTGGALIGGFLVAILMLPYFAAVGFGATSVATAVESSDDIDLNVRAPETTTITDSQGNVIAYRYTQNRTWVDFADISDYVKKSVVSIEDRRFYSHRGVDWRGTARAALGQLQNATSAGGGSTITQQYIKNYLFLVVAKTDAEKAAAIETTPLRKLREARLAITLEQTLNNKNEILERYLNTVAFAPSVYGVQAASQYFFGKDAANLDLNEGATLAAMVNNPNEFNPFTTGGAEKVLKRRNLVLDAMVRDNKISQQVDDATKALPLTAQRNPKPNGCIYATATTALGYGYYCQYVLDYLTNPDVAAISGTTILEGGLTIKTYLDPAVQAAAYQSVTANTNPTDPAAADIANVLAIVQPSSTVDVRPVKALAVNRPYGLDVGVGQTVNRLATTFAPLGAGSTFKIFTAAAAMEAGMGTDTTISVPTEYLSPTNPARAVTNPSQFDQSMTLERALATSPNTAFVSLEDQVGLNNVAQMAVKLGLKGYDLPAGDIDTRLSGLQGSYADQVPLQNMVSFTLGVSPVSPTELANVGATLASNGRWCPPTPVDSISDRDGLPVTWTKLDCVDAVDPNLANSLAHAMEADVHESYGTAHGSLEAAGWDDRPAAGKTGTTQDYKSSAFLGFTPYYSGATIVFDYETAPESICVNPVRACATEEAQGGQGMSGGSVPAKTWGDAMVPLHQNDTTDFAPASLLYQKGDSGKKKVPVAILGMPQDQAIAALEADGFVVPDTFIRATPSDLPPGTVIDQLPKAPSEALIGSSILLTVAQAPAGQ